MALSLDDRPEPRHRGHLIPWRQQEPPPSRMVSGQADGHSPSLPLSPGTDPSAENGSRQAASTFLK